MGKKRKGEREKEIDEFASSNFAQEWVREKREKGERKEKKKRRDRECENLTVVQ